MGKKYKIQITKSMVVDFLFVLYDIFAIASAYFLALWFRFDGRYSLIPKNYLKAYVRFLPYYAFFCVIVFYSLGLYRSIWKYASALEVVRSMIAGIVTGGFHMAFITAVYSRMPISYYFFGAIFQFILITGIRFFGRFIIVLKRIVNKIDDDSKRVMIVGAGEAGRTIIKEIKGSEYLNEIPVCVIDADKGKWKKSIEGVPVVGDREKILESVEKYKVDL